MLTNPLQTQVQNPHPNQCCYPRECDQGNRNKNSETEFRIRYKDDATRKDSERSRKGLNLKKYLQKLPRKSKTTDADEQVPLQFYEIPLKFRFLA